jgi:hypothetical protein
MGNLAKLAVTIHHVIIHFSLFPANGMFYTAVLMMPNYPHTKQIFWHKVHPGAPLLVNIPLMNCKQY